MTAPKPYTPADLVQQAHDLCVIQFDYTPTEEEQAAALLHLGNMATRKFAVDDHGWVIGLAIGWRSAYAVREGKGA